MFSRLIQRIFFGQTQGIFQSRWRERATRYGSCECGQFYGVGRPLAYMVISPQEKSLPDRCVIFCHPISRKGKYFFSDSGRVKKYLDEGLTVLIFDFNGFCESDSMDLFYWKDVQAAIDFVVVKVGCNNIVLHGVSFGAFHMVRAIGRLPIHSTVIFENVNKSLSSYWSRWKHTALLVRILELLKIKSINQMNIKEIVEQLDREDLDFRFIACENDEYTTVLEMQELYGWLSAKKKSFTVFPNAGHLAAPIVDSALYSKVLFERRVEC